MERRRSLLAFLLLFPLIQCMAQGPAPGSVIAIRQMEDRRSSHTATLLRDGRVLITGGFISESQNLSSAELFDPAASAFRRIASMASPRIAHAATLLQDGRVLITGGLSSGRYLRTAEIFDPATRSFSPAGNMTAARSGHVAIRLRDGRVLLAGGTGAGWSFLASAEIYDPRTNSFTATGAMTVARESHTATLLNDGAVLITGGHSGRRPQTVFDSTEIFDPATGRFTAGPRMTIRRHKHDAVRLADGRVLITGGTDEQDERNIYRSAEIFDPARRSFTRTADLLAPRYKHQGTSQLLPNGLILIAGGADTVEIFDPVRQRFLPVSGTLGTKRLFATATLLGDGSVLVTGGYDQTIRASSGAWLFRPI